MRKIRVKTTIIVTFIAIALMMSHDKIMSFASEKDDYIIITKDGKTYDEIVDKYEKKMINDDESGLLKEGDTAAVYISEWEANKLEKDDDIECIEPIRDVAATGKEVEWDDSYIDEWNLKMIKADNVSTAYNDRKIKVAILDSGIEYNENINVVVRKNFIEEYEALDAVFEDTTGHGTSIASIAGAKYSSDTSVKGINSNIEIYSGKILDENNIAPMDRVIESIYWAIEQKVDIISISFGTDNYSEALEIAIKEAYDNGILIVAAAGNEHVDKVQYPAAFKEVLSVGGVDNEGNISEYSSTSKDIDVYAPGDKVKAIGSFDGEIVISGTSIAVPHVVGVASVLWQENEEISNEFVKQLIISSSNKSENLNGKGIIDLEYALEIMDDFVANKDTYVSGETSNDNVLYTDDSVNYVTGSWGMKAHQSTVTDSMDISSLTSSQVTILKWGAVYPDKSSYFKGMTSNPYFHGYSKLSNLNKNYNYLASYIYLTRCALNGDNNQKTSDLTNTSGRIGELDEKLRLIKFGSTEKIGTTDMPLLKGYQNTKENRSLFYLGMAMHTAADIYAHSAYAYKDGKWIYISHSSTEITESDNTDYKPKRYKSAKKVVSTILSNYLAGKEGSVNDFVLSNSYYDGSFKLRKMYDYASEIQTLDSGAANVLKNVTHGTTADKPQVTPTPNPTVEPTIEATIIPTQEPVVTQAPVDGGMPNVEPIQTPEVTVKPTVEPTQTPEVTVEPTVEPTQTPEVTVKPTKKPQEPTLAPTKIPTTEPTVVPTQSVTEAPTVKPTVKPTESVTDAPVQIQTPEPTQMATNEPASVPTDIVGEDTSGKQNAEEEAQDAEVVLGPTDGDSDITTGSVSSESDYDSDELDDTVKTGDKFNIFIIVAVMGICGLMVIVIKSRKGTRIR